MKPFIKIHPADTVAVALSPLKKGTEIQIDDQIVVLTEDIPQGHKFALTNITEGDSIIKYGNSIGVAKTDITKGSWIHTHNMKTGLGDLLTYTYNKETAPLAEKESRFFNGYRRNDGRRTVVPARGYWLTTRSPCPSTSAVRVYSLSFWAAAGAFQPVTSGTVVKYFACSASV